jgi:hypothetical protein
LTSWRNLTKILNGLEIITMTYIQKYKGEYVAINDSKVIDHGLDYERLIVNRLKQRFAGDTIRVSFIGKIYENQL